MRARFYSPELGIFLSRDPFPGFLTQPASLTPYQYAFNNPVRYTDPSGENPLLLGLLGSAISGFGISEGMCPLEALNTLLNTFFDPPPPSEMTEVEKIGMGLTVALTIIAVVLPIEIVLILLTFEVSAACASGAVPACLLDVPLVAADIVVADFGVSLSMHAYESISSGYKKNEFEWIIIPSISDIFNE